MTKTEYLLTMLLQESSEVQKEATKILLFGQVKEGDPLHITLTGKTVPPNVTTLRDKIIDLLAIIEMLVDDGILVSLEDVELIAKKTEAKIEKVEEYMKLSHANGVLKIK